MKKSAKTNITKVFQSAYTINEAEHMQTNTKP